MKTHSKPICKSHGRHSNPNLQIRLLLLPTLNLYLILTSSFLFSQVSKNDSGLVSQIKELIINDSMTNSDPQDYTLGFTWVKHLPKNVLVRPWFVPGLYEKISEVDTILFKINKIPVRSGFKEGDEVWVFSIEEKTMHQNKIREIQFVHGLYGFDGGDLAIEVNLETPITIEGKIVLLNKPFPRQDWKMETISLSTLDDFPVESNWDSIYKVEYKSDSIYNVKSNSYSYKVETKSYSIYNAEYKLKSIYNAEKIYADNQEFILLSLDYDIYLNAYPDYKYWETINPPIHMLFKKETLNWQKVYEDREWSLIVIADIDGDKFPEFYIPYTDSEDGDLISIYPIYNKIQIHFPGGH